jgi:hypothetical protein
MLSREEYIEQAYFWRMLGERLPQNQAMQELLAQLQEEVLATTDLPKALNFMNAELKHMGSFHSAMARLSHYFTAFQTYLIQAAEDDRGRFDMRMAVEILRFEAEYKAGGASVQGLFLFQFEVLSRHRLRYDKGMAAMAADPFYNADWKQFILATRLQIGIVDMADLVYVRSEEYQRRRERGEEGEAPVATMAVLFGEKEGRIALANRRKDPLYFFAALQRQLNYPAVPRVKPIDRTLDDLPQLLRRMERLEVRLKLLEEENKSSGIDLTKFYDPKNLPPLDE